MNKNTKMDLTRAASGLARRWRLWGCLAALLVLGLPLTAQAAPLGQEPVEPEPCAGCHREEAATWQDSPHAHALLALDQTRQVVCTDPTVSTEYECGCLDCHSTDYDPAARTYAHAGVSCEACHGDYVAGHPQEGTMRLAVDASVCAGCHATTYEQWQGTAHAQANVQCTSCHVAHSQETRLGDDELCASCHQDRDNVHHAMGVSCTDCHISPPPTDNTFTVSLRGDNRAPDHRFGLVAESCAGCHSQSIHESPESTASQDIRAQLVAMQARTRELARSLEETKRVNDSLKTMSVVSLGFGLGVGGMVGIIAALVVGYIIQRRAQDA